MGIFICVLSLKAAVLLQPVLKNIPSPELRGKNYNMK